MKRFHANGDFQCKVLFIHDAFFVIREELHLDIHTYVQYMPTHTHTCLRNLVLRLYNSLSLSLYLTSTTYLNHIFFLLSLPSIPVLNLDLALYLSLVYLSFLSLSFRDDLYNRPFPELPINHPHILRHILHPAGLLNLFFLFFSHIAFDGWGRGLPTFSF